MKVEYLTPEMKEVVTIHINNDHINRAGLKVFLAAAQCLITEMSANSNLLKIKDGKETFYNSVIDKIVTDEKLQELQNMDKLSKDLLSRIVAFAQALLMNKAKDEEENELRDFVKKMKENTASAMFDHFLMVHSIRATQEVAEELRKTYSDAVISEVVNS